MVDEPVNNDENKGDNGVKINLISSRKLDSMSSEEKLRFIISEVKKGTVLVLERGLTATEEINLIKATMSEIDHQTFIGIEMQSYSSDDLASRGGFFSRLLGRAKVPKMSVIGPANLLKTIHKNGSMIQAMILTGKSIVSEIPDKGTPDGKAPDGKAPDEKAPDETEVELEDESEPTYDTESDIEEIFIEDTDEQHALPIKKPKSGVQLARPVEDEEVESVEEAEVAEDAESVEVTEDVEETKDAADAEGVALVTGSEATGEDGFIKEEPSVSEEEQPVETSEPTLPMAKPMLIDAKQADKKDAKLASPLETLPESEEERTITTPSSEPVEESKSEHSEQSEQSKQSEEKVKNSAHEQEPISFLYKRLKNEEE